MWLSFIEAEPNSNPEGEKPPINICTCIFFFLKINVTHQHLNHRSRPISPNLKQELKDLMEVQLTPKKDKYLSLDSL